ncbi:TonB-dependent receptor [Dysgonomonas sp. Shenzhen-Wh21]|uniref:TonB-dependent receptor n=1 Tax=Dysgonomonas TaxID=156973 RepID=UPI00208F366D|nr:TonB-dependent receptor [Dysgonomonas mossii]
MRSTILLLLFSMSMFATNLNSQSAHISISLKNKQIGQLLSEIEKQTDYLFVYKKNDVDLNRKVSVNVSDKTVESVLRDVFSGTDISYAMEGNSIMLLKAKFPTKTASVNGVNPKKKVSGIVVDKQTNEPIVGASVFVPGTIIGVMTDIDGRFSLELESGNEIEVSFLGYRSQRIKYTGQDVLDIALFENTELLDEVVVVGYGTQKKENLTGAVSQVKMADVLGSRPVVNAMNALQGAMPGLLITSNADGPGQFKTINIRGTTSINGGDPLVLIDNVPGDVNMINPEDIESVSVLKDAASSAIYGARAAFGVILITTKKAKKGERFTVNYNNNFGFQKSINQPDIADGMQWLQAYKNAEFGSGSYYTGQNIDTWMKYLEAYRKDPSQFKTYGDGVYVDPDTGINYYLNEKNVYTNMFDDYGFLQNHNLSMSGGAEKVSYRLSLGYNEEDGILYSDKDRYERLSTSAYIHTEITPWLSQSVDFRYSRSKRNMPVTSEKETLYDMRLPSLYPEGYLRLSDGVEFLTNTPKNMLELATDNRSRTDNPRILSQTVIKPFKGLEMVLEYTFDKKIYENRINKAQKEYTNLQLAKSLTATSSSIERTKQNTDYNAINAYATYTLSLGKHNTKIMGGFNQESSDYENLYTYAYDLINDELPSFNTATGESKTITESISRYTVRGAFYRLNYDYEGRYLFEANGRYDGSSKFPQNSRFGFFPSFSGGWNIARESFFNSYQDLINELKIRGSWGQIGNQAINPYQYTPIMGAYAKGNVPWIVNGDKPVTLYAPGLVSDNFTWETVETLDLGLDVAALNGRLRGTLGWYQRTTKDMLAPGLELPAVVGAAAPLQNTADLRTKGWEISLSWRDQIGEVSYNIGFNLSDNKSKITKYDNKSFVLFNSNGGNNYFNGYEIGTIWGYETDGFYTIDDFEDTNTWKLKDGITSINGVSPRPGDIKFKNLKDDENSINRIDNGDGTLGNPGDMKIIGNSAIRMQYGISIGANYKGFDLNVLFQGVGKRDVWLSDARRWAFASGQFGQIFKDQLDYWQPTDPQNNDWTPLNSNPEYFRIYNQRENAGSNTRRQTKYLLDGSYLRIKNITLAYTLPKSWIAPVNLRAVRLFISCENLHTFSSLPKGYDPERLSWGYPFYRTTSFGINVTL